MSKINYSAIRAAVTRTQEAYAARRTYARLYGNLISGRPEANDDMEAAQNALLMLTQDAIASGARLSHLLSIVDVGGEAHDLVSDTIKYRRNEREFEAKYAR